MTLLTTASQTIGPYGAIGLKPVAAGDFSGKAASKALITIRGCVIDGDGAPVTDALLETWQADARGCYVSPDSRRNVPADAPFRGFTRMLTDGGGGFQFTTIKPGTLPCSAGLQAPHLVVLIFTRGLLKHLMTRVYFPNETANAADPILVLVPTQRRSTLIARSLPDNPAALEWNVVLQGKDETVFFDY